MDQNQVAPNDGSVDVLIIGAGPAGLMLSLYLSELGISHRIIDQRGTRALNGRADGFHVRTVEIWESFGMADKLHEYGNHFGEWALWTSDPQSQAIVPGRRERAIGEGDSKQKTVTFSQGYIEAGLIEAIKKRGGPSVERGSRAVKLLINKAEHTGEQCNLKTVTVQRLSASEREEWPTNAHYLEAGQKLVPAEGWTQAFGTDPDETKPRTHGEEGATVNVRTRFLVGADGAHSWLRHQLPGFSMDGASSDSIWGVMDIVPITDFPDIRRMCTILSSHGAMLLVPREKGLVRFYIQLADDDSNAPSLMKDHKNHARFVEKMFSIARRSLSPYSLDYKYCDWWTVYAVGQRVCSQFSESDEIFLVGDAVHTHTPKGGQGMNVSQQDAYNLAWKLGGVIRGELHPSALSTYASERRPVAEELISLDTDLSKVLTTRTAVPVEEVRRVYDRLRNYGSGVNVCYSPNSLVASGPQARLDSIKNVRLGNRMKDATIFYLATGIRKSLLSALPSKGYWYLLVFGGDVLQPLQVSKVNDFGNQLLQFQQGAVTNSTKASKAPYMKTLLVLPNRASDTSRKQFHEAFSPRGKLGDQDCNTIFTDLPSEYADPGDNVATDVEHTAYDILGIEKKDGALCLVRPDQVVSWVGGIDDAQSLFNWISALAA